LYGSSRRVLIHHQAFLILCLITTQNKLILKCFLLKVFNWFNLEPSRLIILQQFSFIEYVHDHFFFTWLFLHQDLLNAPLSKSRTASITHLLSLHLLSLLQVFIIHLPAWALPQDMYTKSSHTI